MPFDANQMRVIELSERTMSVFSLIGSLFIISTFIAFPFFRKPINRLVFYASIGNILCNIATLISTSGLDAGESSSLCQFQGVLIQWFIPADSLWTFCMALNVYLTFFKNYAASNLRSLEKWYLIFCYGVPLVPALVYLLLDAGGRYGIYGPATIWCWVSVKWDWMRIAFFYGPVWIVIGVTTTIYVITGKDIFKQRAALRAFSKNPSIPLPVIENPFTAPNLAAVTKVTEIRVTSETIRPASLDMITKLPSSENGSRSSFSSTRKLGSRGSLINQNSPVQVTEDDYKLRKMSSAGQAGVRRRNNAAMDANTAAWGYAKVAMLMFVALFIVWVPSTVNRVYSLVHPDNPLYVLNLMSALVLPLQGFWNAMIYIATSWSQCGIAVRVVFGARRRRLGSPTFSKKMTQVRQQHNLHRQKRQDSTGEMNTQDAMDMDSHFDLQDFDVDTEHMVIKTVPRERQASDPFNKHDSTIALPLSPRKS
ncbi:uncharacterized protein K441DRAFT_570244 [Cenococcum geophilum 1.58]|uniref:uncharacterized protein n=1 Tax=Cenococcum geophilum 1.58 TaxID=794803 RepID=UPI00358F0458|nr:hypothetical protein K441DRAFT_570244 [Cenococcum geophilum 1.58]